VSDGTHTLCFPPLFAPALGLEQEVAIKRISPTKAICSNLVNKGTHTSYRKKEAKFPKQFALNDAQPSAIETHEHKVDFKES
jgi:hypothetical protein